MQRVLRPAATKLGIRVNLQIMRRTFATLANDSGADLKDIQAQLRHSKTSTTADVYVQPIPLSVKHAVEELDRRMRARSTKPLKQMPSASPEVQ